MTEEQKSNLMRKLVYLIDQTYKMSETARDLILVYRENLTKHASEAEHLAITEMLPAMIDMAQTALYGIEERICNTQITKNEGE